MGALRQTLRSLLPFILGAPVLFALQATASPNVEINLLNVGVNVILAVSLNIINGFTGQFSLGHAGFMAVGAYAAALLTTSFGVALLPLVGGQTWLLFLLALLAGGVAAAIAGLIVGVPSLRLRGDYL